ncbi:prepilin-type N-terminal cleavage/methylation domain-containing protein [Rhodoferax sp.]|uniref:prepilin-type N-terminal cleavage/methylation domain-containing protein n=1 Tax=Rhodoferax sp. TaxID=50421 RepID=UPI002751904B|nr:prepilin-type N-terminal cleavage/methylation domain-containing protein [Rhodoferax sp.]
MNSRHSHPRRRRQAGFGLLEVLVSLVIFAGVGFTLLAWFQQSVDAVQRLRTFYEVQDARKTVLEFARTLNPMRQPSGELAHGALRLVWATQPEGDEAIQTGFPRGVGRHSLRLYSTTLTVYRGADTSPWFVEKLTLIGHRLQAGPTGSLGDG